MPPTAGADSAPFCPPELQHAADMQPFSGEEDAKMRGQRWHSSVTLYVNGRRRTIAHPDPEMSLLEYLRSERLTGAKLGCGEGGCGACMVGVASRGEAFRTVNSCLAPLCSMDGCSVTTVEGIGSKASMHPVQESLAKSHASQCGFCTPGFVVSMYAALRNNATPTMAQIERCLDGNLCRCTGYRPILDAFRPFAIDGGARQQAEYDAGSDKAVLPPALEQYEARSLRVVGRRQTWYRPVRLSELLELKAKYPDARLVCGNTEVGIEVKFKHSAVPTVIAATHVAELTAIVDTPAGVEVGGSVTYARVQRHLERLVDGEPEHTTRFYRAVLWMLKLWASTAIRNVASVAGNLCTASPIGDIAPLLMSAGSAVTLASLQGTRRVPMREFYLGYRRTAARPDEVLLSVTFPKSARFEYYGPFKTSRRREDDIAIVNAGLRVTVSPEPPHAARTASFAFGGMGPTTKPAPLAEAAAVGRVMDAGCVKDLCDALSDDLQMDAGAPGGQVEYRRTLAGSFLFKFVMRCEQDVAADAAAAVGEAPPPRGPSEFGDVGDAHATMSGAQHFDAAGLLRDSSAVGHVGEPVRHMASDIQCTGEARYCDDVPSDALIGSLVVSTRPHARIVSVDESGCESVEGFVAYVDRRHVRGSNSFGPIVSDDLIFAEDEVVCAGQVIGIVVAETKRAADEAARMVRIQYHDLPAITSIAEAIEAESYFPGHRLLEKGDVERCMATSEHVLEGELNVGGQEHFYLETQATLATPGEDGEMDILTSSQAVTKTQSCVAEALGVASNRVVARVKRMGGGFGGKETRNIFLSCAVAVAAQHTGRAVKAMLDRDVDMSTSGTRHPFHGKWRVGFSSDGAMQGIDARLWSNAGCSHDLSYPVMERACAHIENAYHVPHTRVYGRLCRTNCASNTAFRGFGGPQGMVVAEAIVTQIARHLGMTPEAVRERNLYREGQVTHYKQVIPDDNLRRCWSQVTAGLAERRAAVDRFNGSSKWRKRGLCAMPVKFGMSFNAKFMNQAAALVHLYQDGTVLVSHGGTEMGQGLHTKMAQVASTEMGIPLDDVYIAETATDRVANTAPTAASVSADMNGFAIQAACRELMDRLAPIRERLGPDASIAQVATAAHFARVDLSARGFYATPDIGYDFATQSGAKMFHYYSNGAAVAEVEVDTLTGEWTCGRADIVHDVGLSLNPAIDVGQIEGAFVQGMGCFTMEELMWGDKHGLPWVPQGLTFTRGPSTYKIPAVTDVPSDFRVELLRDAPCKGVVHSSKGIGEPPLFLGSAVFFAICDAVDAARAERGLPAQQLNTPASVERIRMACRDEITDRYVSDSSFQPRGCW
eukprot:TRINITY_DN1321_c6_g1_i1.p1 TRINITY_DN1321_c6_g1~~TRINITY_DN1321_c6_g1_i1.p1  ORF type:complete len:1373 (+),score=457.81 TRINITY_DN1321_c6_g1_i1:112-4119(+)